MTEEELATDKQICMFCLIDMENSIEKQFGKRPVYVDDPAKFGRTQQEYDSYRTNPVQAGSHFYQETEISKPNTDENDVIKMEDLLNNASNNKDPSVINVYASEDFSMTINLPGTFSPDVVAVIREEAKKFFEETARFGLQSKTYGQYVANPEKLKNNNQGQFGFGMGG